MSKLIQEIEKEQMKEVRPEFAVGDNVRVHVKIIEKTTEKTTETLKERIQVFEGTVISRKHEAARETFTVRKLSHGIGVERTFLVNSPRIVKIEVTRRGKVRRAKLFYLRQKVGKATKIKEVR